MTEKNEIVEVDVINQVAVITPMSLISKGMEQGTAIEDMAKLFDLQLRYEENEAKKAFNQSMSKFKSENIQIYKDTHVSFATSKGKTEYNHATLDQVVSAATEALCKYGLSHSWSMSQEGSNISVTCKITHVDGHSQSSTLSAGADQSGGKNSIQAINSTVTYLERYTFKAVLGLSEKDDDGQRSEEQDIEYITESQACDYDAMMDEIQPNVKLLFQFLTVKCGVVIEAPAQIPAQHFKFAVDALEGKRK